jgi:hypothetical protein
MDSRRIKKLHVRESNQVVIEFVQFIELFCPIRDCGRVVRNSKVCLRGAFLAIHNAAIPEWQVRLRKLDGGTGHSLRLNLWMTHLRTEQLRIWPKTRHSSGRKIKVPGRFADNLLTAKGGPMEIGPVSAVRPVSPVRPSPPGSGSLTGVFAAEFRDQQGDDSYSPGKASRGLEDEESDDELEGYEPDSGSPAVGSESSIRFIA